MIQDLFTGASVRNNVIKNNILREDTSQYPFFYYIFDDARISRTVDSNY